MTLRATEALRILLVEDSGDHAELIKRGFESHRLPSKITHVSDGAQALDYLYQRGTYSDRAMFPPPQLVLLDLRLPKVPGMQVLREAKSSEDLKHIPIVVISTSNADIDVAQAYKAHANSYVVKPSGPDQFDSMIGSLGRYWIGWNHKPE